MNMIISGFHIIGFNPLMHMSQNGRTHYFKNLAGNAARFLKCVRQIWDIRH